MDYVFEKGKFTEYDLENAIKYLKMTMKFSQNSELKEKAYKRLNDMGYII